MRPTPSFFILSGITLFIIILSILTLTFHETPFGKATSSISTTVAEQGNGAANLPITTVTGTIYVYGSKLVATKKGADVTYHYQDQISSNRFTTNSLGRLQAKSSTYPFGKSLDDQSFSGGKPKYTFTGKENDGHLMYFGARYLDPRTGRFTSIDPLPRTFTNYGYGKANPLRFTDPTGMGENDRGAPSDATAVSNRQGGFSLYDKSLELTNTWVAEPFVNLVGPVFEGVGNILALPEIIGGPGTTENLAQAAMMVGPAGPAAVEALGAAPGYLRAIQWQRSDWVWQAGGDLEKLISISQNNGKMKGVVTRGNINGEVRLGISGDTYPKTQPIIDSMERVRTQLLADGKPVPGRFYNCGETSIVNRAIADGYNPKDLVLEDIIQFGPEGYRQAIPPCKFCKPFLQEFDVSIPKKP